MVVKYCPKCTAELEVHHKCPNCRYIGPALLGKNNGTLKEVKEMEKEESHQRRLMVAQEELRIAEDLLSKLEPLKEEYDGEIEWIRKAVMDIYFKFGRIKEIAKKIEVLKGGVEPGLWDEILGEKFPSSEQVILTYCMTGWRHRLFDYLCGELKK